MNGWKSLFLGILCLFTLAACNKKKTAASMFEGSLVFYDDFSRADGPLGTDWNGYFTSGSIAILNGMAQISNNGNFFQWATYVTPVEASAYSVSADFTVATATLDSNSAMAVMGNMNTTSANTMSEYVLCGFYGSAGYLQIITSNEAFVAQGTVQFPYTVGTSVNVSLVNDGENGLTCTATDGSNYDSITYTMNNPEIGQYVGFAGGDANAGVPKINVDDFLVISLDE